VNSSSHFSLTNRDKYETVSSCALALHKSIHSPNDVSNEDFNPVISKIQMFMAQNNRKSSGQDIKGGLNKLSFLSIRNLWTNPGAAQILERNRPTETND